MDTTLAGRIFARLSGRTGAALALAAAGGLVLALLAPGGSVLSLVSGVYYDL
jgi:hypothetical protein